MGAIGRQRVKEELAWEYSAKRLLEAYEKVSEKTLGGPQGLRKTADGSSEL
jgi:hypothetical protein